MLNRLLIYREKHLDLRSGFDNLDRKTAKGPNHNEFIEPKVQGLWRVAQQGKFSDEELDSLKVHKIHFKWLENRKIYSDNSLKIPLFDLQEELHHYESRLLKLRHLHTEAALEAARKGKENYDSMNSSQHIKKHARTVEKLHMDLEAKILQKHTEL